MRLAAVYEHAPAPSLRYGASRQEKKQLDAAIVGAEKQNDVELTEKLQEAVDRGFLADQPILEYRDGLYHRLPPSQEKYVAALRDANARLLVAAPKDKLAEALQEDLPQWVTSGEAKQPQARELAEMFGKLRFVESPPYYASAGVRKGKVGWVEKTDKLLTPKKFTDLHKVLLEAATRLSSSKSDTTTANVPATSKKNGKKTTN